MHVYARLLTLPSYCISYPCFSVDVTVLFAARTGALQKLGRRYTVLPIEAKVRCRHGENEDEDEDKNEKNNMDDDACRGRGRGRGRDRERETIRDRKRMSRANTIMTYSSSHN